MTHPARFRFHARLPFVCASLLVAAAACAQPVTPAPTPSPTPTPVAAAPRTIDPAALPGRYSRGTANAPLRIVVFADFQCSECQHADKVLQELLLKRSDIELTMRHFPLCAECNKAATTNIHPNACKAALAAEAAGVIAGAEAFWRMHDWLFATGGEFKDADLTAQLNTLGIDTARFGAILKDASALKNIHADIELGIAVGLHTTPLILINGEEAGSAATVEALSAACDTALDNIKKGIKPELLTPQQRWLKLWKDQPAFDAAGQDARRWLGASAQDAKVEIVLFGDLQERACASADQWLRGIVKERTDARYTFKHYPADSSCNKGVPKRLHPLACKFAATAEAMGAAGGDDAYWKTHDRIFLGLVNGKGQDFTDANLRDLAADFKLDPAKLMTDRSSVEILGAVQKDVADGRRAGITELPTIFINKKRVVRFQGPGVADDSVLRMVIDAAAHER